MSIKNIRTTKFSLLSSLCATILLAACSTAPMLAPTTDTPLSEAFRGANSGAVGGDTVDLRWWASFGDPVLAAWVERALEHNHDVATARQRVRAARAGLDTQSSRLWPTVNLQGHVLRSSSGLPDPVKQGQPDTQALRLGLDLSWEIDLAGARRAARDAAEADVQGAQAGTAGARLLVASELARQYFVWRGAAEQLGVVQALAKAQRETARLVEVRQREGQASVFDLDRARAEADAVESQLPPLRTLIGVSQNRMAVLMGANPSLSLPESNAQFVWPAAKLVEPGQPSQLLQRRPDLIAAEARFAAETLRGQEARAQWWPKLFLSAVTGRQDLQLNALDLAPVRYSSVALALVAPVFNAGRIEAAIEGQSALAHASLHAWQQAVLTAVQEVEDSLLAQAQELQRTDRLVTALAHRQRSLQHAQRLLREGQIDLLTLLDVQRSVLASELALSASRLQMQLDAVQLFKALGGGYQTRNGATPLAEGPAFAGLLAGAVAAPNPP
jgi:NodT family efflux transporter outer membrane factor (OMF) lipoprotein